MIVLIGITANTGVGGISLMSAGRLGYNHVVAMAKSG
jgi:hypothetical protein